MWALPLKHYSEKLSLASSVIIYIQSQDTPLSPLLDVAVDSQLPSFIFAHPSKSKSTGQQPTQKRPWSSNTLEVEQSANWRNHRKPMKNQRSLRSKPSELFQARAEFLDRTTLRSTKQSEVKQVTFPISRRERSLKAYQESAFPFHSLSASQHRRASIYYFTSDEGTVISAAYLKG